MSVRDTSGDGGQPERRATGRPRRAFIRNTAAGAGLLMGGSALMGKSASAADGPSGNAAPVCSSPAPGGAVWVTPDCDDPTYNEAVVDAITDETVPVPHRRVSGHFAGTDKRFTVYLSPKRQWQGRFFQNVYPLQNEIATDDTIAFGAASGAYTVQTNGGGGYRVDAAAAKFSRRVAADYYGTHRRIHGYIWGGSGGSFQTTAAIENTSGVWDGAVPYILGSPVAIPNYFFVRALARLVLGSQAERIADAMRPGGSGDPYAGLDATQRMVLREVTLMGVPLRAWQNHSYVLGLTDPQGLLGFAPTVHAIDPTYTQDFWTKPGYLGTEASALGDLFRTARVTHAATIARVTRGTATVLTLDGAPASLGDFAPDVTALQADGSTQIGALQGTFDLGAKTFTLGAGNTTAVVDALSAGGKLRIDNGGSLAVLPYHRYQVPKRAGFAAWDQFRNADGTPVHPQRPVEIGPLISKSVTGGGTWSGEATGKVIVVCNLLDTDAYPWDGDWYRTQARQALGAAADDTVQLWYNDNADHIGPHLPGLVDYTPMLQQALRDVAAWAESGIQPPRPTRYTVTGNQVAVPDRAEQRCGVQPVVTLTTDGGERVEIAAGDTVRFRAHVHTPPNTGRITSVAWDFEGTGHFEEAAYGPPRPAVEISATFTYRTPGTYFPVVRVTSQRNGTADGAFAAVPNLARVRVVVR